MTTGFNLKSQEKKALQEAVDKAIREVQSLDEKPQPEFLFDKETTGNSAGSHFNRKVRHEGL